MVISGRKNFLLDCNCLKPADLDCTAEIGSDFEACIPLYGCILGSEAGPDKGIVDLLGPQMEQFALGLL
jgi:hypothetical protein